MSKSETSEVSAVNAVLLGALSSGVNGPTWSAIKITFCMLGACLAAMLALAFTSRDFTIMGHVLLLLLIGSLLFVFLSSFLAETGLVSVAEQMKEMGLSEQQQPHQHVVEEAKEE